MRELSIMYLSIVTKQLKGRCPQTSRSMMVTQLVYRAVMELIDDVVHDPDVTLATSTSSSADEEEDDAMADGESSGDSIDILGRLLTSNEKFRRKINERHLREELQKVCT